MDANTTFLEITIWDFCAPHELRPLDDLVRRRYAYYCNCRAINLFPLYDEEAKRIQLRTTSLETEVTTLHAAKSMIVRLRSMYMKATADIGEAIYTERLDLLQQTQHWKSRYEQEHAECMREKADVLFWVEKLQNYQRYGTSR